MAFVNEYVSEEDIEKYQLKSIWLEHNPLYKKEGKVHPYYRFKWTIDRERDIYLMEVGGGGYDQFYTEWVLYWRQEPVTVHLSMPATGDPIPLRNSPTALSGHWTGYTTSSSAGKSGRNSLPF